MQAVVYLNVNNFNYIYIGNIMIIHVIIMSIVLSYTIHVILGIKINQTSDIHYVILNLVNN